MTRVERVKRFIQQWGDAGHRWMVVPVVVAALLTTVVLVKSCQGIVYMTSPEYKIHRLGYPTAEARLLLTVLSQAQADSLIARGEHDTAAIPLVKERYFIAGNFDRYLAYHKQDTTGAPMSDIIAVVNVGRDLDPQQHARPCDTTRGYLMLVNRLNYLDEHYTPRGLVTISREYTYEENRADSAAVKAFVAMQQECKRQTGAQLMVNSAYRSYQQQIATFKRNDKRYVAHAGRSEHQTGLALDITSRQHPMRWPFDTSVEGVWMREHCHEYGFILRYPKKQSHILGYSYEPWHLRYVGVETATRVHDEGITYDEYYAYYLGEIRDKR